MIGVIADDLTGAAEIGGIGLRYGLKAEVFVGADSVRPSDSTRLVCIDSDSRSAIPAHAAKLAAKAAAALAALRPEWIYTKVDSVLRGNVLAEVEAITAELGLRGSLLVPANPGFGRIIRDGTYYVKGRPISETDFARDPEYPRWSSDVRALLGLPPEDQMLVKPGACLPERGVALGEVSSAEDVAHWARQRSIGKLCAGGAEFFEAVMNIEGRQQRVRPQTQIGTGAAGLFICGSLSDATRQFVAASKSRGVPVFYLPEAAAGATRPAAALEEASRKIAASLTSHSRVILSTRLPLLEDRAAARQITIDLVRAAKPLLREGAVDRVYVEGGATAAALVQELGWSALEVIGEIAPGVTTLKPHALKMLLTIKPGSYPGWPW